MTGAGKKFTFRLKRLFQFSSSLFNPTLEVGVGEAQALMQIKNAHCHTHARDEPVSVERFVEEIVNAGIHCVQIVGFSRARRNQDDVSEARCFLGTNSSAELQPVDTRHHPIGDNQLVVPAFPCFPGIKPIRGFDDAVSQLDEGRVK